MQEKFRAKGKKHYFGFADLEKAFVRVLKDMIRWAMCKLGVEECLVSAVMSIYTGTKEQFMDFLEQETVSGSGIIWATCKCAPCLRQITMPMPHNIVFYRPFLPPNQQRQSIEGKVRC